MKQPDQPDLPLPEPTTTTLTVKGEDLERTEQRLRDLGAVILGFSVKGSIYTLTIILPPGELLAEALGVLSGASQVQPCRQERRSQ
jgi:hypothetical protein